MVMQVGDARFYHRAGPYSVAELAALVGAPVDREPGRMLTGVAPLARAAADEVSFLDNSRYRSQLGATQAGAVIVHPRLAALVPAATVAIVTPKVYEAWAKIAALFHPAEAVAAGIHPTAVVAPSASIHATARIGAFAVIGANVQVGAGSSVGDHVSLGAGVVVGSDCRIGNHVTISHAIIGDRVGMLPGVRVGQDGFGFARTETGYLSVPQLGRVLIEDDVDIGANTTIDRGSAQDTVIGAGSRIDNLVQIGHNVRLGRGCVIVAQVGISGSTELEDYVQVGGQAAMAGHLHIGRGAQIGAQAGVISDIEPGAIMLGSPAQPRAAFFRQVATLKKMAQRVRTQGTDEAGGEG